MYFTMIVLSLLPDRNTRRSFSVLYHENLVRFLKEQKGVLHKFLTLGLIHAQSPQFVKITVKCFYQFMTLVDFVPEEQTLDVTFYLFMSLQILEWCFLLCNLYFLMVPRKVVDFLVCLPFSCVNMGETMSELKPEASYIICNSKTQ